jgi:hypothetical protein
MNIELSKRDKDTANKKEGRELKNQDTTGSIRRVRQRKFRSTWEREKNNGEFKAGNQKRENRYWMEGEERRCRMCYEKTETIEHMWNGCSEMRERK